MDGDVTDRTAGDFLVAALASHLESNAIGGVALDLDGTGRKMVEVLVEELQNNRHCQHFFNGWSSPFRETAEFPHWKMEQLEELDIRR